jgi:nitrogen fixation-related uncharacterized protein
MFEAILVGLMILLLTFLWFNHKGSQYDKEMEEYENKLFEDG